VHEDTRFLIISERLALPIPNRERISRSSETVKRDKATSLKSCRAVCPFGQTRRESDRTDRFVRHAARGKLRNAVLHNVSHAPRRRSRYDGDAKPQDRSTARACICAQDAHAFPPRAWMHVPTIDIP